MCRYLLSSLVLFLIFSQFFIAILVNAFDEASHKERRQDAIRARPPGFIETKKFSVWYKVRLGWDPTRGTPWDPTRWDPSH